MNNIIDPFADVTRKLSVFPAPASVKTDDGEWYLLLGKDLDGIIGSS